MGASKNKFLKNSKYNVEPEWQNSRKGDFTGSAHHWPRFDPWHDPAIPVVNTENCQIWPKNSKIIVKILWVVKNLFHFALYQQTEFFFFKYPFDFKTSLNSRIKNFRQSFLLTHIQTTQQFKCIICKQSVLKFNVFDNKLKKNIILRTRPKNCSCTMFHCHSCTKVILNKRNNALRNI